uniref:Uncharacterized protein n=1 Tax=Fibrocapsa japonica TaxID=94617 RepID=A0A7S2Y1V2_9STRA
MVMVCTPVSCPGPLALVWGDYFRGKNLRWGSVSGQALSCDGAPMSFWEYSCQWLRRVMVRGVSSWPGGTCMMVGLGSQLLWNMNCIWPRYWVGLVPDTDRYAAPG